MTEVKNSTQSREVERRAEELRVEKLNREKGQSNREDFARLVSGKQENTAKANRQAKVAEQTVNQKQNAATNRLMARQGIQANTFQSKLQQQGTQNVAHQTVQQKSRQDSSQENRQVGEQKDSEATTKRLNKQGDKLAAISRDDRQSGQGDSQTSGGSQSGSSGFGPAHGEVVGQGAMENVAAAETVQAPAAPQLPPEVVQQIVERVMVGVNQEGLNEFHIEFKDNVLAGSTLALTAKNGRITARFNTQDVNVKRLLQASEGQLARAFGHKGLILERLEVTGP